MIRASFAISIHVQVHELRDILVPGNVELGAGVDMFPVLAKLSPYGRRQIITSRAETPTSSPETTKLESAPLHTSTLRVSTTGIFRCFSCQCLSFIVTDDPAAWLVHPHILRSFGFRLHFFTSRLVNP